MAKSRSVAIKSGIILKWKKLYCLFVVVTFNLDVALEHETIHCLFRTHLLPESLLCSKGKGRKDLCFDWKMPVLSSYAGVNIVLYLFASVCLLRQLPVRFSNLS